MLALFFSAFALGLVFNAAPGAVFAETIRQGALGGFRAALAVQTGSLVGDAIWAALGLAGAGLLLQIEQLRLPIGVAGVIYLLWLSWSSWKNSAAVPPYSLTEEFDTRHAYRAGIWLSLSNPQNVAYWAALGSAFSAVGVLAPRPIDYAVLFFGFMMASVGWSFFCAALVSKMFSSVGSGWSRTTHRLCAVAFLALALASIRDLAVHPIPPAEGVKQIHPSDASG